MACTKTIATQRGYRADQDDDGINERLQNFALDYIQDFYAVHSSSDLAEIGKKNEHLNYVATWICLTSDVCCFTCFSENCNHGALEDVRDTHLKQITTTSG